MVNLINIFSPTKEKTIILGFTQNKKAPRARRFARSVSYFIHLHDGLLMAILWLIVAF